MSTYLLYSFGFGQSVVQAFTERYARGVNFVERMSGISHEEFSRYLIKCVCAKHQVQWEAMKRLVKQAEHMEWEDYRRLPLETRRKYLTYVKWNAQDEVLDQKILHSLQSELLT